MANLMFGAASLTKTYSRQRQNREYLISSVIAQDLNTYKNFGIFKSWNDVYTPEKDEKGNLVAGGSENKKAPGTPAVRSIFNKYAHVLTGNSSDSIDLAGKANQAKAIQDLVYQMQEFRQHNNVPLVDTPANRRKQRESSGCSVKELVQASQVGAFGKNGFQYADFMYCKHLGRVPNTYLCVLRRYPGPVNDNIMPYGSVSSRGGQYAKSNSLAPVGTMVTWLGVSGNEMQNILKYEYNMSFREQSAGWEQVTKQGGENGLLNGLEALINPATNRAWEKGYGGEGMEAMEGFMGTFFNAGKSPYTVEPIWDKYKVYGAIDRVKSNYLRGEEGLTMAMNFSLVFEYELRAYNGINPRQAMLDLIANILSVTYTTGKFWGGGYRGGGMAQSSIFSNLKIFKAYGGLSNFLEAFSQDLQGGIKSMAEDYKKSAGVQEGDNWFEQAKAVLNQIGGLLFGGLLNKLGRPAKYFANSLLTEAPSGLWHLTIGNPWHPIMSMGNMIIKKTTIEHSGPLGLDDFPTNLKVTIDFDRGRPRDQYGIEAMYMGGNDRIFHSQSGKLLKMYDAAAEYQGVPVGLSRTSDADTQVKSSSTQQDAPTGTTVENSQKQSKVEIQYISQKQSDVLTKYFGPQDDGVQDALLWTAKEMAEGQDAVTPPADPPANGSKNSAQVNTSK